VESAIVVFDHRGALREGQIVEGAERVAALESQGVILLPYESQLHGRRGARGYFRRSWGEGWALNSSASTRICPAVLDVEQGFPWIFWVACVGMTHADSSGQLRLLSDTQGGHLTATLAAGDQSLIHIGEDHPHPSADRGFIIGGRMRLGIANPGIIPLSLYGYGRGLLVRWLAVSQAKNVADPAWLKDPGT
jgi:hypothetical protein